MAYQCPKCDSKRVMVIFTTRVVPEKEQVKPTLPHGCPMSCLECNYGWIGADHEHYSHPEAPAIETL